MAWDVVMKRGMHTTRRRRSVWLFATIEVYYLNLTRGKFYSIARVR